MFGGDNYASGLSLSKPQRSWKDKVKNHFTIMASRFVSLDVVAHDLEVQGAIILNRFNVLHGFIVEIPRAALPYVRGVRFLDSIEPTYDLKALHG